MKSESHHQPDADVGECASCPNNAGPQADYETQGRRRFLNYLLGTGFGATAIAIFYPILKFITPPQVIEAAQNSVTAGKVNELALNSGKIFKFGKMCLNGVSPKILCFLQILQVIQKMISML